MQSQLVAFYLKHFIDAYVHDASFLTEGVLVYFAEENGAI